MLRVKKYTLKTKKWCNKGINNVLWEHKGTMIIFTCRFVHVKIHVQDTWEERTFRVDLPIK
jgi:hypothetical protein